MEYPVSNQEIVYSIPTYGSWHRFDESKPPNKEGWYLVIYELDVIDPKYPAFGSIKMELAKWKQDICEYPYKETDEYSLHLKVWQWDQYRSSKRIIYWCEIPEVPNGKR